MGKSMAGHILKAGYPTTVYNRTEAKCAPLAELGAKVAKSPREVAEQSDVVFTMVGYPSDVREAILGDSGVLVGLRSGGFIVDMTTSTPSLAVEIAEKAKEHGVLAADAPVSGGDVGARNATLSIMFGGDKAVLDFVQPVLDVMGKTTHVGKAGAGQHTKMTNQIIIATNIIGVTEGLLYAQRAGLDVETTLKAVSGGAAGSWSVSNYGPRIQRRELGPGFYVEHFVKDLGIALDEARKMNLSLPGLALANQLYIAMIAQGHSRLGIHALTLALERLNALDNGPFKA